MWHVLLLPVKSGFGSKQYSTISETISYGRSGRLGRTTLGVGPNVDVEVCGGVEKDYWASGRFGLNPSTCDLISAHFLVPNIR
jgi:hypothetical protein